MPDREDLLLQYLEDLPYEPYPVQEEALMTWYTTEQGVLMCAPTGTGKTLVAEGALYEAMHRGQYAYYTTPLIALTDQKFLEMQDAAERWGFERDRVGLVTGNRTVNPNAQVLVVVAEILLNRLLHKEAFDFRDVGAVVMDEFHSFGDADRGIVWELTLAMLPAHVRLMLLSATVGNASEFTAWLRRAHGRNVKLVQGTERRVPLHYHWIGEELLEDWLVQMNQGNETQRKTPALVFCFDREGCWQVAETMKGKDMLPPGRQAELLEKLDAAELDRGIGPKLKQILRRGVGVHHAGLLPKHRRLVEELFQQKLLSVCVCTETLAAGINLPARSVVLSTLVKGPKDKKKLMDASSAQQMFGRAGRPQFDAEGHVYAVAHADDVKIAKFMQRLNQIPEDTKDPGLIQQRKKLEKKKPTRRNGVTYWNPEQFEKLQAAEPGKLVSRGFFPYRLLAYLLDAGQDIAAIRDVLNKRLMDAKRIEQEQVRLTKMLVTLHRLGYVVLEPTPPEATADAGESPGGQTSQPEKPEKTEQPKQAADGGGGGLSLGDLIAQHGPDRGETQPTDPVTTNGDKASGTGDPLEAYQPQTATPTDRLKDLLVFRAVHPLYGAYLVEHMGLADSHERVQLLESLLEMPGTVARRVRVPWPDDLPPGALATEVVDPTIIRRGLLPAEDLYPPPPREQETDFPDEIKYPIPLADKMKMMFESEVPFAGPLKIISVWAAGDLLTFGGDFHKFISARELARQEGVVFRHLLRLILLCGEFRQLTPPGLLADAWQEQLDELANQLTATCRSVDERSTDETLEEIEATEEGV